MRNIYTAESPLDVVTFFAVKKFFYQFERMIKLVLEQMVVKFYLSDHSNMSIMYTKLYFSRDSTTEGRNVVMMFVGR